MPIGSEDNFRGMVDLVEMKAYVWFGDDKDTQWEVWDVDDKIADKLNITVVEDREILRGLRKISRRADRYRCRAG